MLIDKWAVRRVRRLDSPFNYLENKKDKKIINMYLTKWLCPRIKACNKIFKNGNNVSLILYDGSLTKLKFVTICYYMAPLVSHLLG